MAQTPNPKLKAISSPLQSYEGTYLGFSPTDESNCGIGELEVIISPESIIQRHATGLEIQTHQMPVNKYQLASKEDISSIFGTGVEHITMFYFDHMKYIFSTKADDTGPKLLIAGSMGDILGPTMLFSSEQVQNGQYQNAMAQILEGFGGTKEFPTLANNGKAPK